MALLAAGCCGPVETVLRSCPLIGQGRRTGSTGLAAADSRQQIRPQLLPTPQKRALLLAPQLTSPPDCGPPAAPCLLPHRTRRKTAIHLHGCRIVPPAGRGVLRSSEVARDSNITPFPWVDGFRQLLQYCLLISLLYLVIVRLLYPSL